MALGVALGLGACALVGLGVALGVAAAVPAGAPVMAPGGAGVALGSGGMAAATDSSGTDAALATAARYLRRMQLANNIPLSDMLCSTYMAEHPGGRRKAVQAQLIDIPRELLPHALYLVK